MEDPLEIVRLVCDRCGSQNKISIVLSMACFLLATHAPKNIKKMELFSPMTGHSFFPPDRVFGLTEQVIRKMEVIYHPSRYIDVITEHAKVVQVGKDCQVFDWKLEKDTFMKGPAQFHFELSIYRRMILKKRHKGM